MKPQGGFTLRAYSDAARRYCIHLLERLVDIPSVFPEEEEIQLFLEQEFASLGLKPQRIEMAPGRWNLLCSRGDGSPRICLNAHCDTVPPNGESTPNARIEGDFLHGLGSCDTKASIASMTTAYLDILSRGELSGTADLLISVDEEGDGNGVRSAIQQGYTCDYAIVGEPTDLNVICTHNGLLFLKLITTGLSAHGCSPENGINAVERMLELIDDIRKCVERFRSHDLTGNPSLNLGEIHAGDRPNRVPDRCVSRIDIRFPPPVRVSDVESTVLSVVEKREWARCEIEKRGEALDTPPDSPLIKAILDAGHTLGLEQHVAGLRGWTEAEPFRTMLGIDSVVMGPGSIKQAHTSKEFVSISQTQQAAVLYAEAAARMLGIA
jgi:acetylornithine deacetylase/succinyl-diaminopimelate desuccinylase-like protein